MEKKYTAIVRKSKLEYIAICLELNISARGDNLADVEKNLKTAIELYLIDIKERNPFFATTRIYFPLEISS